MIHLPPTSSAGRETPLAASERRSCTNAMYAEGNQIRGGFGNAGRKAGADCKSPATSSIYTFYSYSSQTLETHGKSAVFEDVGQDVGSEGHAPRLPPSPGHTGLRDAAWCLRVREHPCAPENLYESGMSQPGNAGRTPDRIIRHDVGAHGAENIGPGTLPAALLPDLGGHSSPGKKGFSVTGRGDAAACQSAPSVPSGGVVGPVGVGGGGKGKSRTNNHAPPPPAPRRAALALDRLF